MKKMTNIKSSTSISLYLLVGLFILLAGISAGFTFATRSANMDASIASQKKSDLMMATYRFHAYALDLARLARMYVVTGNTQNYDMWHNAMTDGTFEDILSIVERYTTEEEQLLFDQILEGFDIHREMVLQAFALLEEGNADQAFVLVYGGGITDISEDMMRIATELVGLVSTRTQAEVDTALRRAATFDTYSLVAMVLLVLSSVIGISLMAYRFTNLLQQHKADTDRAQFILDSLPLIVTLWDENYNIVDCNAEVLRRHGSASKDEYIEHFAKFMPEFQPDGTTSVQKADDLLSETFTTGGNTDWTYVDQQGNEVPMEVFSTPMEYKGSPMLLVIARDMSDIRYRERLLSVVNQAASILLAVEDECSLQNALPQSMELIGRCLKVDRTQLWRLSAVPEGIRLKLLSQWQTDIGLSNPQIEFDQVLPIGAMPEWDELALQKKSYNGPIANMSPQAQSILNEHNTLKSVFYIPVILQGDLWGLFTMDDCVNERTLSDAEMDILRSASLMIANAHYRVEQSTAKMMETEGRWRQIYEVNPIGVNFMNPSFQIIDSNEVAYKEIFGFDSKEEYMQNMQLTLPKIQPDGSITMHKIAEELTKVLEEGFYRSEWMVLNKSGDPIPLDVSAARLLNEDGEIMLATFLQDLRPLRDADAKMREAEMELQQQRLEFAQESDMAKTRFLARMSHEIRTPITAVLGVSEIQLRSQNASPHIEEAFAKIHDSANNLLGIVNDILDFSKIESGNMELINTEYEVASLVSDATQLRLVYLEHKNITFALNVDENLPSVLIGDELRIRQIMNNLLSNAFKYTTQGFVMLSLGYEEVDEDRVTLVVSIRDTGFGMTPKQLETLSGLGSEYKRFHEHENLSARGTGLGISIVHSLVQMMDATIYFQSEVGVGTYVVVRIPQKTTGAPALGKESALSLQNFEVGTWSSKKFGFDPEPMPYGSVLVVDDVEANLYVAKGLLAFYELNVEAAENGQAAIDKIKEKMKNGEAYDIVFMDQTMPGLSGTETMRILRELGYTYPIVALTANALVGQEEEYIKSGFDGFVSKPIRGEHLHTVLIKHIKDKITEQKETPDFESIPDMTDTLSQMFVKGQANTFANINQALNIKDIKTAHRLVHSLKSSAGLINEHALAKIAEEAELTLIQNETPSPELLAKLKKELAHVLAQTGEQLNNSNRVEQASLPQTSKPAFAGGEVLVVEDDTMNIAVACAHLKRAGLKCIVAKDGKEAVDIVQKRMDTGKEPFDLIFMDIYMPEMDGKEAASIITRLNTGTPIIAMTAADASPEDKVTYTSHGMEGYIKKPFTAQQLRQILNEYFNEED